MANLLGNATRRNIRPEDYTYKTPVDDLGAVGIVGEVQLVDADGTPISSLGGGVGGGDTIYSNAAGDFTTLALTGTKNFNILGAPFPVELINVALGSFKKISGTASADVVLTSIALTATTGGYTVTVSDESDNFIGTDVIAAQIVGPQRAYDTGLDVGKMIDQAPDYAHYIGPIDLISATQAFTGPFVDVGSEIPCQSYNVGVLYTDININGATGLKFKLLAKHESGGTEEYPLPTGSWTVMDSTDASTGGYKTLNSDADAKYCIPFELEHAVPYLQFQAGAATAGTAGTLGHFESVVYTLGYK